MFPTMRRFPSLASPEIALSALLLVVTAHPCPLHSQTAQTDSSTVLKSESRAVLVDIVVTDKDGKPAKGLHPENFAIAEDGHPQNIVSFEEHSSVSQSENQFRFPPLPPNLYTNIPRVKLSDAVTVLLLDSLNTELKDQTFVHKEMLSYLKNPQPGRRMAIFALGSKLHFVQGFTTDPAVLVNALNDLKRGAAQETSDIVVSKSEQANTRTVIDNLIELGNESRSSYTDQQMAAQLKQFMGEQTASITDLRVSLTLEAFQQLAHYLSGIPGRKNVVWFSSAFPLTLFANQSLTDPSAAQREFTERVKKTARLLAAADVAVYPVAAAGLETDSLYDVNQKMVIPGEAQQKTQQQLQQSDSTQRVQNQSSMDELAKDTGGQAIYNTNGLADALTRISDASANYYTLSYVPPNEANDGAFHKIQVKLPGSYKLSYRRGYFASDPVAEATEEAKSHRDPLSTFMGPGLPDSTDFALAVRVIPDPSQAQSAPSAESQGVVANPAEPLPAKLVPAGDNPRLAGSLKRYSVDFLLTAHGLQLQPTADGGRQGKAEIAVIAYDQSGRALNWIERAYQLKMNAEQFSEVEKRGLKFHLVLDIPKDGVSLRTGICDLSSHRVATLEVPLASVINPEALAATAAK